jgi:hypothetical protein
VKYNDHRTRIEGPWCAWSGKAVTAPSSDCDGCCPAMCPASRVIDASDTWRADVLARGETTWASNALRFDSRDGALSYARELSGRWMAVDKWRAVTSDTPSGQAYTPGSEDGSW